MLKKFTVCLLLVVHCRLAAGIVTNRSAIGPVDYLFVHSDKISEASGSERFSLTNKCTSRLHVSLEKLRKRQANAKYTAFIDLSGYALHQTLRHLPLDMYITDIRVRTPGVGDWVRIEKCHFSNRDNKMTAQILFNDLTVSGTVQLLDENENRKNSIRPAPREFCKMSLRFEKAGLGINAFPTKGRSRGLDVRTEAKFLDPKFLSVHAYGCKLNDIFGRQSLPADHFEIGTNSRMERLKASVNLADGTKRSVVEKGTEPEVRIVTLNPEIRSNEDSSKWFNLHNEDESDVNECHRLKVLESRFRAPSEADKLKAILHVQRLITQQANHVFQMQGPFSQIPTPLFKPYGKPKPPSLGSSSILSTITEVDENLSPIRPVPQKPFDALLFAGNDHQPSMNPSDSDFQNYYEVVSREMESVFLNGIKTLLTRYVEKQLEIPLKETLMVNIGYTVSYG